MGIHVLIVMAVQTGVTNYIVKPFTQEVLSRQLEDVFGSKAA